MKEFYTKNKILFYSLIVFIIYGLFCSVLIGKNWDSFFFIEIGKDRLSYLLSLGTHTINEHYVAKMYPGIYNTLSAFLIETFPNRFELETYHIINFTISFLGAVGLYKFSKKLFNKEIALITFFIFFLNPIFFGHSAINDRDTVVLFSNVWISFYTLKYLEFNSKKNKKYVYIISILLALGMGVRFAFLATLLPIFLYACYIIFKKKENISFRIIFLDFLKVVSYSVLIILIFWVPAHKNLFIEPIELIKRSFDHGWGYPYTLFNGEVYAGKNIPTTYVMINLFHKSPEYIIFLYLIFFTFVNKIFLFYSKTVEDFKIKTIFIFFNILIPSSLLIINPFAIYDGLRLFLFIIPYFSIIPAITVFFILKNIKKIIFKTLFIINLILVSYFFVLFINLTPYHYTYLNYFAGKYSNSQNKYENDYWGTSLKELIKKVSVNKIINNGEPIRVNVCGVSSSTVKYYSKKYSINVKIVREDENPEFVISSNRVPLDYQLIKKENKKTCFDKYSGNKIEEVKRLGLTLSAFKKVN